MTNEAKLLFAAAVLATTVSTAAYAQLLPHVNEGKADTSATMYFVKNVSGQALRCAFRINSGAWSRQYDFPVNYEFTRYSGPPGETLGFACRAPAEQVAYRLQPGQRYAALRRNGQIRVSRLVPR